MTRLFSWAAALSVVSVFSVSQVSAYVGEVHNYTRRATTGNGWDIDGKSFDYVIVGGGTAGLVLANRLSADGSNSVAVIEAGPSGYEDNDKFVVPSAMLYDSAVNTQYDWQYKTTSQKHLNGKEKSWPRGKVLGGSSAINGLYYVRPSREEADAWAELAGKNGWNHWGWDNLLNGMKKSEKLQTPLKSVREQAHIEYDGSSHGRNGPIHTTWPAVTYGPVGAFIESASKVAVPRVKDAYGGENHGTYVALSSMNKRNWQRSFSRNEYLDPISDRNNLQVLTGHLVTQVIFDRSDKNHVQATGVHYKASVDEVEHTVHANKEVILCAGAINTPQILQLSGIGSSDLLNRHGIDVVVDLPGVGENLQDHISFGLSFRAKNDKDVAPQQITGNKKTDSYVNSAVSYVNFESLFKHPDHVRSKFQARARELAGEGKKNEAVRRGQEKTYESLAQHVFGEDVVSPVEILGNLIFGSINIQAALQHPLSRGYVRIKNKNPFEWPLMNPNYLKEDMDMTVLRQALKLIRKISQESPLKDLIAHEDSPGSDVQSNEDLENWIRENAGTEYHPSSTCSMLPRSEGGVVAPNLKVHGTSNLRVADASIPPLSMSCHLESVVYGIAEIAADLILGN